MGPWQGINHKRAAMLRQFFVHRSDNLGHKVTHGAKFTFLGIAIRTLVTILSTAVLARLLSPADFGYVAMAVVVSEFAGLFGGFGLSNILIQKRIINRIQLDTVFWASVFIGIVLSLSVYGLSFVARWFYKEPLVGDLLRLLSLTFVLNSLTSVHWALLTRLLRFKAEFWIQIVTILTRTVVAIFFALAGFGVWSLVYGPLVAGVVSVALYFMLVPYTPRLKMHWKYLSGSFGTSASYFMSGFLYYASMNLDLLLIGRVLGASALGYYQNTRSLTDEIRARIAIPLQRVLFPAFSAIQHDIGWLRNSVERSGRILAAIVVPVGFGVAAVAEELVPILYGNKWLAMVPLLQVFGLSAAIKGATAIASALFNSQNRVGLALKYNFVGTVIMVLAILGTLPYGLNVVAVAIAIASSYSLVSYVAGLKLIGIRTSDALRVLGAPFGASFVMLITIYFVRASDVLNGQHPVFVILELILLGAVTYGLMLYLMSPLIFGDFRLVIKKLREKK